MFVFKYHQLVLEIAISLHFVETNQLEDPRQQWHEEQERMLKDYLHRGALDLEVSYSVLVLHCWVFLYTVKFFFLHVKEVNIVNFYSSVNCVGVIFCVASSNRKV